MGNIDASRMAKTAHWFRKGLRLHDNPALLEACSQAQHTYPVFVIDPAFSNPSRVGVLRYHFLLDSLRDLNRQLEQLGGQLYVLRGDPLVVLPQQLADWGVTKLTWEADTEPYAQSRDAAMKEAADAAGISTSVHHSHTLREIEAYSRAAAGADVPRSYGAFCKLFDSLPAPRVPAAALELLPHEDTPPEPLEGIGWPGWQVPAAEQLGYPAAVEPPLLKTHPGGESEALVRLQKVISQPKWLCEFDKPKSAPNSLTPSTSTLSPYLKFGCLSASRFYHEVLKVYKAANGKHTQPPVSMHGQLLWREYNYTIAHNTTNFDKMVGNPRCRQIPWDSDQELLAAWKSGRTGYPFIDAIMTQLAQEGWIHHLARHSVACFLTRGDLWQSWEDGARVFDELLLDADWAINNFNWQWLSCSAHFYQYFRCYSPVAFGKKTDKSGQYIRRWLPALSKLPDKYIYEPWLAPEAVQIKAGCIVGQDYPTRVVLDHQQASKANMAKMQQAYQAHKANDDSANLKRKANKISKAD